MIIRKNRRRPFPYFNFSFPILFKRDKNYIFGKSFKFTDSCIYEFEDGYRGVNKLFGFSMGHHHNNSFRFGWRPNQELNKIEIVGYQYKYGFRSPYIEIEEVDLNRWYFYEINYLSDRNIVRYTIYYHFVYDYETYSTYKESEFTQPKKCMLGYKLGLYFGGKYKAPQDIIINSGVKRC